MSRRRIGQEAFGFADDRGSSSSLDDLSRLIDWGPVDEALIGMDMLLSGHSTIVGSCMRSVKDEPIRDVSDLFYVMREVVNSDPSRLRELWILQDKHPKLIVFYNFNYELVPRPG